MTTRPHKIVHLALTSGGLPAYKKQFFTACGMSMEQMRQYQGHVWTPLDRWNSTKTPQCELCDKRKDMVALATTELE